MHNTITNARRHKVTDWLKHWHNLGAVISCCIQSALAFSRGNSELKPTHSMYCESATCTAGFSKHDLFVAQKRENCRCSRTRPRNTQLTMLHGDKTSNKTHLPRWPAGIMKENFTCKKKENLYSFRGYYVLYAFYRVEIASLSSSGLISYCS